jgi:hypothetical protein
MHIGCFHYPEDGGRKVLHNIHAYTCTNQNDLISQKAGIFQVVGYKRGTPLDAKGPKVTHISLPLTLPVNSFVNCSHNVRTRTARDRAQLPLWLTEKVQFYGGTRERVTYFNKRRRRLQLTVRKITDWTKVNIIQLGNYMYQMEDLSLYE